MEGRLHHYENSVKENSFMYISLSQPNFVISGGTKTMQIIKNRYMYNMYMAAFQLAMNLFG